jgi:putative endopeptidase
MRVRHLFAMAVLIYLAAVLALAAGGQATAGNSQQSTSSKKKSSGSAVKPHGSTKKSPETTAEKIVSRPKSFDMTAMDKSADPCNDFFQYACGGWRKANPIPADQARWSRFSELTEYNRQVLHGILEKYAKKAAQTSPIYQKIGDMYASCMDEKSVNAKGAEPLKPVLDRIAAIQSKPQMMESIAYLQSIAGSPGIGGGGNAGSFLFMFFSNPDLHDATQEIANVNQGGLGLPDRDYYVANDEKSQETRQKYVAHMARMFGLLGDDQATAQHEADAVIQIETKLAEATMERVKMRDPKNRDHKMKVAELAAIAPNFDFDKYFAATGAPKFTDVNVAPPEFFQKANAVIDNSSLDDWKSYLRWHALRSYSPWLSDSFVHENFSFTGQYLNGQKELQPRWKRCTQITDQLLGEALGQPYVAMKFGPDGKRRTLKMVQQLEAALATDIQNLDWMTPETKKQAEVKLKAIINKIGYPDKWRDYTTVKIVRGDLVGDIQRARTFDHHRVLSRIGKPLDKKEWGMTPPTVNAYYNSSENDINFPAGILQPPFYDNTIDDAVNFGGIGVVIGHELTHGFDDQGAKYDAAGNFKNWWTPTDQQEFEKRTGCIADEYSQFSPVEGVHLNGRLTLGENTADNGGLHISLMALHAAMEQDAKRAASLKKGASSGTKDDFTPDQRFFISYAQIWCENATPESARLQAKTNPHSPGQFRVQGPLQNNEDFWRAFSCKPGQKMVSANPCRVW